MAPAGAGAGASTGLASLFCTFLVPLSSSSARFRMYVKEGGNLCEVSKGLSSLCFSLRAMGRAPMLEVWTKTYSSPGLGWVMIAS